jgi:hypothetical protein
VGPYYGVQHFVLDQGNERFDARMPIDVTRFSAAGADVGHWSVGDGNLISSFSNMRHFSAREDGRYLIDFPSSTIPTDVGFTLDNLLTADDTVVLGIRFSGADPAQVFSTTYYNYLSPYELSPPSDIKHDYAAVGSLNAVVSSAGETYWQDVANNIVWVKVRGGLTQTWNDSDFAPNDDHLLYRDFNLRIH